MNKFNKGSKTISFRTNEEIYGYDTVRVIGDGIESTVMTLREAKKLASNMSLDLIEMNSTINPPIVKIGDYEKIIYEMKKTAKKANTLTKPTKEIQLSVNIASNDLNVKARKAQEFLEDGSLVKVVLTIKGRDLGRRDVSKKSILEFITMLEDVAVPTALPKDEGARTIVYLKKKDKK